VLDIVEYVQKKPDGEKKEVVLPEHRRELTVIPNPWNQSFKDALALMEENLCAINPCMLQLLHLWETSFRLVFCCFV